MILISDQILLKLVCDVDNVCINRSFAIGNHGLEKFIQRYCLHGISRMLIYIKYFVQFVDFNYL